MDEHFDYLTPDDYEVVVGVIVQERPSVDEIALTLMFNTFLYVLDFALAQGMK
jgi:hypothetical protein